MQGNPGKVLCLLVYCTVLFSPAEVMDEPCIPLRVKPFFLCEFVCVYVCVYICVWIQAEELANETDSGAAFFTIGEFCEEHGQV